MKRRVKLPAPVVAIYRAVAELEALYPRKFTPDGHLVGSIGEVVAAEALGLTLYPMSRAGHDAYDTNGDVQIKMTAGKSIAMYAESVRLVILRVVSPEEAEIIYDGPGAPVWASAGRVGKNGQRVVSLSKLQQIDETPGALTDDQENEPKMQTDHIDRARRAWPLLVQRAVNKQPPFTYGELGKELEIYPRVAELFLRIIQKYCHDHNMPSLPALAVNSESRLPGHGYDGSEITKPAHTEALKAVYAFEWPGNAPF